MLLVALSLIANFLEGRVIFLSRAKGGRQICGGACEDVSPQSLALAATSAFCSLTGSRHYQETFDFEFTGVEPAAVLYSPPNSSTFFGKLVKLILCIKLR